MNRADREELLRLARSRARLVGEIRLADDQADLRVDALLRRSP